jgi:hypothetical protein
LQEDIKEEGGFDRRRKPKQEQETLAAVKGACWDPLASAH